MRHELAVAEIFDNFLIGKLTRSDGDKIEVRIFQLAVLF